MRPSRGGEDLCRKAREYYYDLLYGDRGAVPEVIVRHIERCSTCQQQVECLRAAFTQGEEQANRPTPSADQAILETLNRQFELLGECVTCSQVRALLPELLIPSQKIRIPTPVTVHVEHCPQCAEDLALLREQGLTADQLQRLSLFYGLSAHSEPQAASRRAAGSQELVPCRLARPVVAALAAFSFDGADAQALRHVVTCPQCRMRVYRRRARIMDGLHAGASREGDLACQDILASDLFDGVMPLGLEAATADGAQERRNAVLAHVRTCRQCMEKAQSLHRTIYAIGERVDSGVDTIYQPESESPAETVGASVYRYPIRVQVIRHEAVSARRHAGAAGRRLAGTALRHSAGLASAAVVAVIAVALSLMSSSTATGTMAAEIRKAIDHAANIHVLHFYRTQGEPSRETWIARSRNVLATKDRDGPAEYVDFNEGVRTILYPDGRPPERLHLSKNEYRGNRELMMLADVLAWLPVNGDLKPVESSAPGAAVADAILYEHVWESPTAAGAVLRQRLTVSVDSATQLPERMVLSRWNRQDEWEPVTTTVFEYLEGPQMGRALTELLAGK